MNKFVGTLKNGWPRIVVLVLIVFVLFFAIEILPLHFGPKQISWPALVPEIKSRMPRIALIAIAVALFVGTRKQQG